MIFSQRLKQSASIVLAVEAKKILSNPAAKFPRKAIIASFKSLLISRILGFFQAGFAQHKFKCMMVLVSLKATSAMI